MLKNINWKVRIKNKTFWVTAIPTVLLLITQVAGLFGFTLDLSEIGEKLVGIASTVFLILSLTGVVVDPTTEGMADSERAKNYVAPGVLKEEQDGV
jgi:phi LC3 family holin